MNIGDDDKKRSDAFSYFVLSYCLLIPFVGTIALFITWDRANEALVFGSAALLYFSGVIVGLLNLKVIKAHGLVEFWASVTGIILSGILGTLSAAACIISLLGVIDS